MRKPEQDFYHDTVKALFDKMPNLDHIRVENNLGSGTPDILWTSKPLMGDKKWGWVELKVSELNTVTNRIDLAHYTGQQANWMKWASEYGSNTYLFVKAGEWYFLVHADQAKDLGNNPSISEMIELSFRVWTDEEGIYYRCFGESLMFGLGKERNS